MVYMIYDISIYIHIYIYIYIYIYVYAQVLQEKKKKNTNHRTHHRLGTRKFVWTRRADAPSSLPLRRMRFMRRGFFKTLHEIWPSSILIPGNYKLCYIYVVKTHNTAHTALRRIEVHRSTQLLVSMCDTRAGITEGHTGPSWCCSGRRALCAWRNNSRYTSEGPLEYLLREICCARTRPLDGVVIPSWCCSGRRAPRRLWFVI